MSKPKKKLKLSKKTKLKTNQNSDESLIIDGIHISRKGNVTYFKNERSAEEQSVFLLKIAGEHKQFRIQLDKMTVEAVAMFQKYDPLELLGGLASYNLLEQSTGEDGLSEQILDSAQSIATALKYNRKPIPTNPVTQEKLIFLLENRINANLQYYNNDSIIYKEEHSEANPALTDLKLSVIVERLVIRGVGYYSHVEELFIELFSLHEEFLKEHYGFNAREITGAFRDFEIAHSLRRSGPNGIPNVTVMDRVHNWMDKNRIFPPVLNSQNCEKFISENPDISLEGNKIISYDILNLDTIKKLYQLRPYKPIHEKVINALSLKIGENSDYLLGDNPGGLLNDSKIRDKPIITDHKGDHYLFNFNLPSRNYLRIGQGLIQQADKTYYEKEYLGKKYFKSRDNFFERKVLAKFQSMLKNVEFLANVYYPNVVDGIQKEKTEIDILGISEGENYLIEVKAGELNEDARMGGLGNLTARLKKNIGEGIFQSERAAKYIKETPKPVFENEKGKLIEIDPSKKIYKIVVVLDNFAGVLTKYRTLEESKIISPNIEFPWVVNIYDLMIFTEILDNQSDFNDFLDKRLALNNWGAFTSEDEIYFLGHFLENDLKFENYKKELDYFSLGNHNQEIDEYFYKKQAGVHVTKPTRKNKS